MIRLAFMTDKARVIGASWPESDAERLRRLLLESLAPVMRPILISDNVAFGRVSAPLYADATLAYNKHYLLTRDQSYRAPEGCTLCHDYMDLVRRYHASGDELVVIGGLTALGLFLPYAQKLDIVETNALISGDLVFDRWDTGTFELLSTDTWANGRTLHLERWAKG